MTTDAGLVPAARYWEWASAAALRIVPTSALVADTRAEVSRDAKRGIAKAARMPKITMTTTNSMRVKPR